MRPVNQGITKVEITLSGQSGEFYMRKCCRRSKVRRRAAFGSSSGFICAAPYSPSTHPGTHHRLTSVHI